MDVHRRRTGIVVITAAAAFAAHCGRSVLEPPAPCLPTDPALPCADACGSGTRACVDGQWGACVVPAVTRACSGFCGPGTEQCMNGSWLPCEIPVVTRDCSNACGPGSETCADGVWTECDVPQPKPPTLRAVIRDFHASHPDFELPVAGDHLDPDIVEPDLGPDDKPVYAGQPGTDTTSGAASFDQWYRDVPGQNQTATLDLPLAAVAGSPGTYEYTNDSFFPIDVMLFGREGADHNYDFTLEAHAHFQYAGGEVFSFRGDDDLFVFINRKLAVNLGGLHKAIGASVALDAAAADLGITPGNTYRLDIFFAERHATSSAFVFQASIVDTHVCD